ncbi:MAG TPA: UvrB/UvrC motif-containing protein [Candidatus Acidoferrum sp.]|jgi:protein arginine kinase activator|nr:UvrB/UvrC motif-containing protein [Candidatus Acidoferrum sp.]
MLCCICKEKEANVHYTQIEGGKIQKVDLCEECAKTKGVNDPAGFSLADLLLGLGASHQIEEAAGGAELKCPRCGFTQADFKKAGRLGCSDCYQTFSEPLEGLLKTMHKGTRHVGKVPEGLRQTRDLSDRVKALEKRLAKAIEAEDFEAAAIIRDELKQTNARPSSPTPT